MLAITAGSAADAATIADLQAKLASANLRENDLRTRLDVSRRQHREDIATIGDRLLSEAEDRDWCSEYDSMVEELNAALTVELPVRKRDYTVRVTAYVDITVTAADEDDARDQAEGIARRAESAVDGTRGVTNSEWDDKYSYEITED
jgi:hypothetical protein